jgi:diketogulonate reductase-like aldo/keto reductase
MAAVTVAGHHRLSTEDAVKSKLIKVLALGAHHIDDAHAIRAEEATEQVRRHGGRTRRPELEMTAVF